MQLNHNFCVANATVLILNSNFQSVNKICEKIKCIFHWNIVWDMDCCYHIILRLFLKLQYFACASFLCGTKFSTTWFCRNKYTTIQTTYCCSKCSEWLNKMVLRIKISMLRTIPLKFKPIVKILCFNNFFSSKYIVL